MMRLTRSLPVGGLTALGLVMMACSSPVDGAITTVRVASGLTNPVYVTHAPGDYTRAFIVEQPGRIRILDITQDPPVLLATPFLNIVSSVRSGGERGLLGLAFHPNFQTNGYFYVNYTGFSGPVGDTVVARYHVPPGTPNVADATSELILLTISQPQSNHNGGWIDFGPDGYLYIATGDGGNFDDQGPGHTATIGNSQDLSNLLGKMLRIDVNGNDGPTGNYGIPRDNPYAGEVGSDEIWAWGLRNPWRNAFDSQTGALYIADVGQGSWEEVNYIAPGSPNGINFGWRCREGAHNYIFTANCNDVTLTDPVYEYARGGSPFRCSITGGEVYRGCAIPSLQGHYFFADWCSDQIWSFVYTGSPPTVQDRTAELDPVGFTITSISSFGRDAFGEIYICAHGGSVYKIVPDGEPSACEECVAGAAPAPEAAPVRKNRYISLNPSDAGQKTALRVTLQDVNGFPSFDGEVRWVGPPADYPEGQNPVPTFQAAALQCTPYFHDWGAVGELHVYGREIVPFSTYHVQAVRATCIGSLTEEANYSTPLIVETSRWGDVVAPFNPPDPETQPDVVDISAMVTKFAGSVGAIIKPRAQLKPNLPNPGMPVDVVDISMVVSAFQGNGYPFTGPESCP